MTREEIEHMFLELNSSLVKFWKEQGRPENEVRIELMKRMLHWYENEGTIVQDGIKPEPQGLDEAAEEYGNNHIQDCKGCNGTPIKDAFKAGAKWMAEQGVTIEKTIGQLESVCAGNPTFYHGFEVSELDTNFLNSKEVGYGDKLIVQIRKAN